MCLKLSHKLILITLLAICFGCSGKPKEAQNPKDSLTGFSKNYEHLSQYYNELIRSKPSDLSLKIELAQFYYNFRDYHKAIELLKGVASATAKVILAKAYTKLKEYDYAFEIFEHPNFSSNDSEYLYLYGEVLEKKNLFPKAVEIYKKVGIPYKKLAQERIQFIKINVEEHIPPEVSEISKEAEGFLGELKDDAAAILLVDEDIEINKDNTSISTVHVIEKVLKERGKELAEVDIDYDSTDQRVELEFARTITKDGKVISAGGESIRDVSRYLNFPLYSNSRAFIISMPSVDVGSFIEYKIKIYSSKLINEDGFSFLYRLREGYPIFKANFRLILPEERTAYFKFFNQEYAEGINLAPASEIKQQKKIYSWNFNKIKPIIPEYAMPPISYVNPAILISSFSSWDQIYKWWYTLYKDKIKLPKDIEDFAKNLTKSVSNDLDKAKKIYEFVIKNIRYVAIEYGDSGYEPHRAEEVFLNRYGDCKDQATLLVAMLRVAGLDAYPVLIPTSDAYPVDQDFPSVNFNHAIAVVKINEKLIFMDPTSETTPFLDIPFGDQDRSVLVFFDDHWQITKTNYIKENQTNYVMDVAVNSEENATIERSVITKGSFAASYRWYLKYTHPALIEEDIRRKMVEISSLSQLLHYEIKNEDNFDATPILTYKFTAYKFLNPAGKLRITPVLDQAYLDCKLISKEKRDFPIDFEGFYTKIANIRIKLPRNLKVKYLPSPVVLDNAWFKLTVTYKNLGSTVDFAQSFVIKKRFVQQDEYPAFKKHLEDAIYRLREEVILEKTK